MCYDQIFLFSKVFHESFSSSGLRYNCLFSSLIYAGREGNTFNTITTSKKNLAGSSYAFSGERLNAFPLKCLLSTLFNSLLEIRHCSKSRKRYTDWKQIKWLPCSDSIVINVYRHAINIICMVSINSPIAEIFIGF